MAPPPNVIRINRAPGNITRFVEELAAGYDALYGSGAGDMYRRKARRLLPLTIEHPMVEVFAAVNGDGEAAAMLFAIERGEVGHIPFIHVLEPFAGQGLERQLIRTAAAEFRAKSKPRIVSETIQFSAIDFDAAHLPLGFTKTERTLMGAPLDAPPLAVDGRLESTPVNRKEFRDIARLFVTVYERHPGRKLHYEVQDLAMAEEFMSNAAEGAFGETEHGFIRRLPATGPPKAAVLMSRVAPKTGYILHIFVHPDEQGRGLGSQLLREAAQTLRDAGLVRVALGVTSGSPARRFYERHGFDQVRETDTYVWESG